MAYPTTAELKSFIETSTGKPSNLSDAIITLGRDAFISALELDCGVNFEPINEVRRFSGHNATRLFVDPYVTLKTIQLELRDASLIDIDLDWVIQYRKSNRCKHEIHFRNFTAGFPAYVPYIGRFAVFPIGNSNIVIDASWGWGAEVPADIVLALNLYALMLNNQLGLDSIKNLQPYTVKEVEEVDRRIAFGMISPEKFLPKHITMASLKQRYGGIKRVGTDNKRRVLW